MTDSAQNKGSPPAPDGLRSRKKAMRREKILSDASKLFAQKGIDATTMAEIAEEVGVSAPTIFNYFGNKDGILIALITEGSDRSRMTRSMRVPRTGVDFGTILVDLLTEVSESTLEIADKRVWRYAEAAAIRHPNTELAQKYATNDMALVATIRQFLDHYDMKMRAPVPADTDYLARLVFDVWTSDFFDLIKYDAHDLAAHRARLERAFLPLVELLFDDAFIQSPTLKQEHGQHDRR